MYEARKKSVLITLKIAKSHIIFLHALKKIVLGTYLITYYLITDSQLIQFKRVHNALIMVLLNG